MHTENAGKWTTPQCPFTIEYSPRVLDDIRLAVVDAFFSLPRGGAEIGGILLGSHAGARLRISDYRPLECEHAFGPGFTLSDRDRNLLTHLLAGSKTGDVVPVGWYHSHTRSEIFLSEADLEIHNTYFPEPWQVALVIKPHTFHPARAGFFFRERGGSIHAAESYREFQLQPLPMREAPVGQASWPVQDRPGGLSYEDPEIEAAPIEAEGVSPEPPQAEPVEPEAVEPEALEPEAAEPEPPEPMAELVEAEPEPPPVDDTPEEAPALPAVPLFLQPKPARSWKWVKVAAVIVGGAGIGSLAYATREGWVPSVLAGVERLKGTPASAAAAPALPPAPAAIGLSVMDTDGELQVHWDRLSTSVRNGSHAILEILDSGAPPRALPLDEAHLESGIFTYARQGERVDVALALDQPDGKRIRESTTFLGKLPEKPEDATILRRQRDDLARQNAQLSADLKTAIERTRKAEKALADVEADARQQLRRRLHNQISK